MSTRGVGLAVVAVALWAGCSVGSDDEPRGPVVPAPAGTTAPVPSARPTSTPEGFALVQARVTRPNGEVCDFCAWLADTADRRARGLMDVTDMGAGAAMVFVYPAPTSTWFWMKNTPLPLSIAFFDASGAYLDAFDMQPCTSALCPSYRTPDDLTFALEVPEGGLDSLFVEPGATLTLFDAACAPAAE